MDLDCRTMLGPYVTLQSKETLRRLLVYLGATAEQLADFDQSIRSWGQGTATITLQPGPQESPQYPQMSIRFVSICAFWTYNQPEI
jgi:hypothetical protein